MKSSKDLDILKGELPLADLHLILPGIQTHSMVIVAHVLTMDIELKIVGNIAGVLIKGFIKAIEVEFLEDKTEYHMHITIKVTTPLLHY